MDTSQGQGGALSPEQYQAPKGEPVYVPGAIPAQQDAFMHAAFSNDQNAIFPGTPTQGQSEHAQVVYPSAPADYPGTPTEGQDEHAQVVYPPAPVSSETDKTTKTQHLVDALFALALLVLGFFFWEWGLLFGISGGVAVTLFFLSCIVLSLIYLHMKNIKQSSQSLLALGVAVAGALPFILFGSRDFNVLIWLFEASACLFCIAYSCKSIIAKQLSGFIAADFLNQSIIVPFANFGRFFISLFSLRLHKGRKPLTAIVIVVVSIIVFIPLLILIVTLLSASDDGFAQLLTDINKALIDIDMETLARWGLNFFLGIPVAAYLYGSIEGNSAHRHTNGLKYDSLEGLYTRSHRLRPLAFMLPLGILVVVYVSYFIAMGSYLTSALAGELPASYTYAQYARQGFFELCGVAVINLIILGAVYLWAQRKEGSSPLSIRVLTGALSLLTIALVITAASKMLLYIDTYGLSPLRLYTSVFMLLLLIVFSLILAWHVKPFNAARPSIIAAVVLFLALSLANTDGLIANYNVQRYLNGTTEEIDTYMLGRMSDATVPALRQLSAETSDLSVQEGAETMIASHQKYVQDDPWYRWNLVSWMNHYESNAEDSYVLAGDDPDRIGEDPNRTGEKPNRTGENIDTR